MNSPNVGGTSSHVGSKASSNEEYDHVSLSDIEEALTPLREAIIDIRRHVEADAPKLNEIIARQSSKSSKSTLQSEIRNARLEAGPRGVWDQNVVLDVILYM
jgi:hypothetical protein